ncbi:MAG: hypothetical protein II622_00705, partial [Thermoguttaceae bacterium]|nr:hypothetical protein [Thermoguttaceae bacterium]
HCRHGAKTKGRNLNPSISIIVSNRSLSTKFPLNLTDKRYSQVAKIRLTSFNVKSGATVLYLLKKDRQPPVLFRPQT